MKECESHDELVHYEDMVKIARHVRKLGSWPALNELSEYEPVIAGYAAAAAVKLAEQLRQRGVAVDLLDLVEREMMFAQVACAQATLLGSRRLWSDLLPPMKSLGNDGDNEGGKGGGRYGG